MITSQFDQAIKARLRRAGMDPRKAAFAKSLTDEICTRCKVTETLLAMSDQDVLEICKPKHKELAQEAGAMKTFRATERDQRNIDTIILKYGAENESAAIRLALENMASGEPQLSILPQLAPIEDLRQAKTLLEQFHRTLSDTIRTGWPDHVDGESPEREAKVETARRLFDEMLQLIRPRCHELTVLCALVAGATVVDIHGAKAVAQTLAGFARDQHRHTMNPSALEPERKKAQSLIDFYKPMIDLFQKCGLI